MLCPHCKADLKYKERGGKVCSACKAEFAFEPKTDPLGLHDIRFRRALAKISGDDKYFYTSNQLLYFLSRKKTKSNSPFAVVLIFGAVVVLVLFLVTMSLLLAITAAVILTVILVLIGWSQYEKAKTNLPQSSADFEIETLRRWEWIYNSRPKTLIADNDFHAALRRSRVGGKARGVLVCPETDVNLCLLANRIDEKLGLILLNPIQPLPVWEKEKLAFALEHKELPVFVLHDASPEGYLLKDVFVGKLFGEAERRRIFDIGLRAAKTRNTSLFAVREKAQTELIHSLAGKLDAEEKAWFSKGYYTPLLSLLPAQLIALVTNSVGKAVKSREESVKQITAKKAEAVGFMTWVE